MKTNFNGALNYRDYVVHIFSGILFNVFLILALTPSLTPCFWTFGISNEIILSLLAVPIMFLEGHFLLAIDRFFFVEFPSWIFSLNKGTHSTEKNACEDDEHPLDAFGQVNALYREAREQLYGKCKFLFCLLYGKRIVGQKIIRKDKDGALEKTKNENQKEICKRYYVLSDFFKGVGCGAWIAIIVACIQQNWRAVVVLFGVIVLTWLRCRFYSRLYVKYRYEKKNNNAEE